MKKITLLLTTLFFGIQFVFSQIQPTASPYNTVGIYSVISDSTTVSSKKVVMYRPNLPPVNKYPVFIFQPGANGLFGGDINVHTYDLFLKHLTSWGFVVLVIDETSAGMPSGTTFKSVHTWLKEKMADPIHWLYTYADSTKVIVGGHSNGGVNASGLLVERPTEIHGIVYFAAYPSDNVLMPHNVSGYTGKVLSLAGSEDNSSTPTACKNGFNAFTQAGCKTYALITGLGHAGFGDYTHSSQVVGSIGRVNATATINHYFLSFMISQFKNDATALLNLTQTNLQPNTTGEFISNCGATVFTDNFSESNNVSFFPNPVKDILNIKIANFDEENISIKVYSSIGALIDHRKIQNIEGFSLDVKAYKKGLYIIKVETNKRTISSKFIIN